MSLHREVSEALDELRHQAHVELGRIRRDLPLDAVRAERIRRLELLAYDLDVLASLPEGLRAALLDKVRRYHSAPKL